MKYTLKQSLGKCVPTIHSVGVLMENEEAWLVVQFDGSPNSSVVLPTPDDIKAIREPIPYPKERK